MKNEKKEKKVISFNIQNSDEIETEIVSNEEYKQIKDQIIHFIKEETTDTSISDYFFSYI